MSGNVQWNGDQFKREVHTAMGRKIKRACIVVSRRAKVLLSVAGTGVLLTPKNSFKADFGHDRIVPQWGWTRTVNAQGEVHLSRNGSIIGKKLKSKKKSIFGAFPSEPGEPPHKQTGRLRASVTYEVDEATLTGRVGSNVKYARSLEFGTKKIKPRPWLRRALAESQAEIAKILDIKKN